jgi:hypothetical protein
MSCQCFCFNCAGKIVVRETYMRHGRHDKAVAPLPDLNQSMVSVQDADDASDYDDMPELKDDDSDSDDDSDQDNDSDNSDAEDRDEDDDAPGIGRGNLNREEVTRNRN